jgi:hypothetical protein
MSTQVSPAGTGAAPREEVIAAWSGSGSRARQIAAVLARELRAKPSGSRVDSSMKIAARFGVNNSMAVRARGFLLGARFICRSDADRHYYVA